MLTAQLGKTYRIRGTSSNQDRYHITSIVHYPDREELRYKDEDGVERLFKTYKPFTVRTLDEDIWEEVPNPPLKPIDIPPLKTELTASNLGDLLIAYKNGNKIAMIKSVRAATGVGLKEAKELVDGAYDIAGKCSGDASMVRTLDARTNHDRDFELVATLPARMFVVQLIK